MAKLTHTLCDICNKSVSRSSDLPRHKKLHEKKADSLMHACPSKDCQYKTLQKSNLKTHFRIHTGEKSQGCPEAGCGFRTSDPGSLTRHRKALHEYNPKSRKVAHLHPVKRVYRRRGPSNRREISPDSDVTSETQFSSLDVSDSDRCQSFSPPLMSPKLQDPAFFIVDQLCHVVAENFSIQDQYADLLAYSSDIAMHPPPLYSSHPSEPSYLSSKIGIMEHQATSSSHLDSLNFEGTGFDWEIPETPVVDDFANCLAAGNQDIFIPEFDHHAFERMMENPCASSAWNDLVGDYLVGDYLADF